ncbi:MAG: SIMPL domain-containing protein [Actinomycetes bacterium]
MTAGDASAVTGHSTGEPGGTIAVSGHGEVQLTPDALRLELSVEVSAIGAADALTAARTTMADVRQAVSGVGVATADQQTSGFNLWQRHDRHGTPNGYQASESLALLLRDPTAVDVVLTVAGEAAGDRLRVGGVGFTVLDPGAARDDARRLALAEAERVARVYADAAGRSLGPLVSLAEGGGRIVGRRSAHLQAASMDAGMEPGTQTVGVDVTAEWHLQ